MDNRSSHYYQPQEQNVSDPRLIDQGTPTKLRTFRGWKRNTAHLDKYRSSKGPRSMRVSFSKFNRLFSSILFLLFVNLDI